MIRVFVDTNIFAYSRDAGAGNKQILAEKVLDLLRGPAFSPRISTQILQEYYNILTKKLQFDKDSARRELLIFCKLPTISMTTAIVKSATELHSTASVSFWDALVVSAAQAADCDELWTEDLNPGQSFGKLKVVNPLTMV